MIRRLALAATLVVVAVGVAGCNEHVAPTCWARCEDGCAKGETCSAGFCAAEGSSCEPQFASVAAGTGFACALDGLHRLWCWGDNAHHQIDSSSAARFERAVAVGDDRWDAISAGGGHVCALRDGELWCWGRNDRHQVTNTVTGDVRLPHRIEVAELTKWTAVSAGPLSTCAVGNGLLYCWGANDAGQLGINTPVDASVPTRVVSPITDWATVQIGGRHACALSRSFGMYCWGDGTHGQLGNAKANTQELEPVSVQLENVVQFSVGLAHTCAITRDGRLFCWGQGSGGELGDPTVALPDRGDQVIPALASSRMGWSQIVSAERYTCGRLKDEVWCWGAARRGGIGDGQWETSRVFHRVLTGASDLSVAWNGTDLVGDEGDEDLSCAIAHGVVQCWGDNRDGQLGQGTATRWMFPVEVAGDRRYSQLVVGASHACGIADSDAYCWGSEEAGQVDGNAAGRATACTSDAACDAPSPVRVIDHAADGVTVGRAHSCVLHDGDVTCWGDNTSGQCGFPDSPVAGPATITGQWKALYQSGADGTCGVTTDDETHCWGNALTMHLPAHDQPLDGAAAVALGSDYGCMLDGENELGCFGNASGGVFGNGGSGTCGDGTCNDNETAASCAADCGPAPVTQLGRHYTSIDVGWTSRFACGLRDQQVECWGDNTWGQAGQVDQNGAVISPVQTPQPIHGLPDHCSKVSLGGTHACALCDGKIACWGDNRHGELGDGTTSRQPVTLAREVIGYTLEGDHWIDVAAGVGFTCARSELGHVMCWGFEPHGALGNGGASSNLPVVVTRVY